MTAQKLDPNTQNIDTGLFMAKSRRVVVGTSFGEMASWVKSVDGGDVVWQNTQTEEINIWNCEAGEIIPARCNIILAGPVSIDGVPESTSSTTLLWGSTPGSLI